MSVSFFWLKSIFGVWALPEKARGAVRAKMDEAGVPKR
jgi:hypothetical protein